MLEKLPGRPLVQPSLLDLAVNKINGRVQKTRPILGSEESRNLFIFEAGSSLHLEPKSSRAMKNHRYTAGVAYKAWHGSLNPGDSYVPLIVAYPGGTKSTIETLLQKNEVCKSGYSKCKGNWNLFDIVNGLVKEQYK